MTRCTITALLLALLTSAGPAISDQGAASRGSINMDQVNWAWASRADDIEQCIEPAATLYPALEIEIIVVLHLNSDGSVRSVEEGDSSMKDTQLGQCLCGVLRTVQFPANELGDTPLRLPFRIDADPPWTSPAKHTRPESRDQAHALLERYTDTLELAAREAPPSEVLLPDLDGQLADAKSLHTAGILSDEFHEQYRLLLATSRLYFGPAELARDRQVLRRLQTFAEGLEGVPAPDADETLPPDVILPAMFSEALALHMLLDGSTDREAACTRYLPTWEIRDGICLPRDLTGGN